VKGVHVEAVHYDEELIPPDDSMPARVTVKVRINGLVAAKATVYGWRDSPETAERLARADALRLAAGRVEKWRAAIAAWETGMGA